MLSQETQFDRLINDAMKLQTKSYYLAAAYPVTQIADHLNSAASIISDVITNIKLAKSKIIS